MFFPRSQILDFHTLPPPPFALTEGPNMDLWPRPIEDWLVKGVKILVVRLLAAGEILSGTKLGNGT